MNQLYRRFKEHKTAYRMLIAFTFAMAMRAGTTGAMPWESPLRMIATSLTGPVAFSISIIGIFATGATLMWGGEMNEFARRAALLGLVVAVIVFATNILSSAFGVTGAVI
ncbi:MAG: TrbC/VirB2 family protein [Acidobacteriaceae bacterium]|nr:TrbC/VirB2 family protein [Acidobacteriaceae bacterium]